MQDTTKYGSAIDAIMKLSRLVNTIEELEKLGNPLFYPNDFLKTLASYEHG